MVNLHLGHISYYNTEHSLNLNGTFSKRAPESFGFIINQDILTSLLQTKDTIATCKTNTSEKMWIKYSRTLNIYENIPTFSKRFINRAAYKAIDLLYNHCFTSENKINNHNSKLKSHFKVKSLSSIISSLSKKEKPVCTTFTSTHLCEAPGGFIQAVNYIINKKYKNINHKWYGTTLKNVNRKKNIPEFKVPTNYNKSQGEYVYGKDNTGDLLNPDNIQYFWDNLDKSELITADGGFDVSEDFNLQEQKLQQLIFAQIITAIGIQKIEGSFILKIFDITTKPTLQLISLLTHFYEDVIIIKPPNSRPCNSEKYIFAKKFKGCSDDILSQFINILKQWENNYYIHDFNIHVPKTQFQAIRKYNNYFATKQTKMINGVVNTIYHSQIYQEYIKQFKQKQYNITQNYCKVFGLMPKVSPKNKTF